MEPFPKSIDNAQDWEYFMDAYHNLARRIENAACNYSDALKDHGFKDHYEYWGQDAKHEYRSEGVELNWEKQGRCGDVDYCHLFIPLRYFIGDDHDSVMFQEVEAKARDRDNKIAEEQRQKEEAAKVALSAKQQAEVEAIRKKMAEDPSFAQALMGAFQVETDNPAQP